MGKVFYLLTFTIMLSSCATILTGTKDTISFNSQPEGATVYKDGIELCKTPCRIPIKRSLNDVDIEFKLDSYETRVFTLDKEFNVVSVINLTNLFGWAIDAATGSLLKYDRKAYDLELKKDIKTSLIFPNIIDINTKTNSIDVYIMQE